MPDTDEAAPQRSVALRRVTPRRATVVAVVLLVVGLLAWGGYWWTHPHLLSDAEAATGNGWDGPLSRARMTVPIAAPYNGSADETITLHSVQVHFATNTAGVTATFAVCARHGREMIGAVDPQELSRYCAEIRPVTDGMTLHWKAGDPPDEYLVMTLRASRVGVARIDQVTFNYARGWSHLHQHGADSAPTDVSMRATAG